MKTRAEIKLQAKSSFKAQYGVSVGGYIVFALVAAGASGITLGLGGLLLMPVLMLGYSFFSLKIYRGEKSEIGNIFNVGFKDYGRNLGGMLWMMLFVILWAMLFYIPGIVKALSYFMTPYVLAEYPNVKPKEALKLSMRMTKGHKGKIFVMLLSFIGWLILSGMTFGILQWLYVGPYMNSSLAGMYEEIKKNALANGVVSSEELA